ncbi:MAG TPA: helix-turn-helix domain-containing protein [Bacilli bacterium]|nr:helix-turn-helix domain-containing protein [Bacilli bacterium]
MQKNICNIKELSIYLQTSIPQIRKLVREKKIPHFRVGNRIKFDLNEINKWIEKLQEKEAEMSVFI